MLRRFLAALPLLALLCGAPAAAQLSLDQVFGVHPPWGMQPSRITWAPDSSAFLYVMATQDPFQPEPIHLYDLRARADRIVIDPRAYGKGAGTPRRTHSIAGIAQRRHLYGHMLQWWRKHL